VDIVFVVTGQHALHEGVVRPFVNFAKALQSTRRTSFCLLNCSNAFVDAFQRNNPRTVVAKSEADLIGHLKTNPPSYVMVDDDLKRLGLAKKLKQATNVKTIAYVQVLYGSHAIARCFDSSCLSFREKLVFAPLKYLPFSYFSNKYAKVLGGFDLVVANSNTTATFLQSLYGVEVDGVVYPPVDTEVFQPCAPKLGNEVTLYLGSHFGDVTYRFIERIADTLALHGWTVNTFGNATIASRLLKKQNKGFLYHSNLTDSELAALYSRSQFTVCPQKWEQFGLVPVESMACGTPTLAFNCMGFQETIVPPNGLLANNEGTFLKALSDALEKRQETSELRKTVLEKFSFNAAVSSLGGLLDKE
jgi:glycosyltransferase involved in cell wall biosynthesis